MRLAGHRVAVELPQGWDGRIYARRVEVADRRRALPPSPGTQPSAATLHAANFALPKEDGDFGTTATATMSAKGVFLALTEYVEGNGLRAGAGLFTSRGAPRSLNAGMFSPRTLLLARPGQVGFQRFFTHQGRPFCLYVVVGSSGEIVRLLPPLNRVVSSVVISGVDPGAGHRP
jgi:hypothetical protein